uniref:SET domain-containing protein n=1 Tax=Neolamprologus brichardi TaxID=32507 RepID=A0A3Q4HZF5_NEOBR
MGFLLSCIVPGTTQQNRQIYPRSYRGKCKQFIVKLLNLIFMFLIKFLGKGVFTNKTIKASAFVVEYRGKIFLHKDGRPKKRSVCFAFLKCFGLFMYSFLLLRGHFCMCSVDASKEDKTLGRLVNDDHISPNCEMKKIGKPHLCLFALKKISPGEEITYNYGQSSYACEDSYPKTRHRESSLLLCFTTC